MEVVDGEFGGGLPHFVQAHVPRGVSLGVGAAGPQDEVAAERDDLDGRLAAPLPVPRDGDVAVLDCALGHLALQLQGVVLHLVERLRDGCDPQRVRDHCSREDTNSPELATPAAERKGQTP